MQICILQASFYFFTSKKHVKPLQEELLKRWLLYQQSSEKIFESLDKWWVNFYCWFDPTAPSLHLGNFIGFMGAVHLMKRGNIFTALTGWATGMVWDPGWKDSERAFLSWKDLEKNEVAITSQITSILKNLKTFTWEDFQYRFINNKDFYSDMKYLDFLREVWKYITVNGMMSKDTVKKRIEDPSKSISYTEFSYMLLQGYDFVRLFSDNNVVLQIWWQDQWGNLVTWTELIRKKYNKESYVVTWPLIVDSSGKKFWKSEGNALWLDKDKTSPYELYQYFVNTADEDLERYLKMLTLIDLSEISRIVEKHMVSPEKREGQNLLAYSVVEIIHWTREADTAKDMTAFMFGDDEEERMKKWRGLEEKESILAYQKAMWWYEYNWENFFETIVKSGLAKSNSEARNIIKSGALYVNEEKINDFQFDIESNFLPNGVLLLRKWKKNIRMIVKN